MKLSYDEFLILLYLLLIWHWKWLSQVIQYNPQKKCPLTLVFTHWGVCATKNFINLYHLNYQRYFFIMCLLPIFISLWTLVHLSILLLSFFLLIYRSSLYIIDIFLYVKYYLLYIIYCIYFFFTFKISLSFVLHEL